MLAGVLASRRYAAALSASGVLLGHPKGSFWEAQPPKGPFWVFEGKYPSKHPKRVLLGVLRVKHPQNTQKEVFYPFLGVLGVFTLQNTQKSSFWVFDPKRSSQIALSESSIAPNSAI